MTASKVMLSQYRFSSSWAADRPWSRIRLRVASSRKRERCSRNLPVNPLATLINMAQMASQPRIALKWMPACTSTRNDPAHAMRSCHRNKVTGLPTLISLRLRSE